MRAVKILHLYPDRMSIYGDMGNIICLKRRLEWRGLKYEYHTNTVGEKLSGEYDLIFMGGGQDKGQIAVGEDLRAKSKIISDHVESGVPSLTICGGYQLFGRYFEPLSGKRIDGIGVFDAVTKATQLRMIGNVTGLSDEFGTIVGFENHSGETFLGSNAQPLAKVLKGFGNNAKSGFEGLIYKNSIGTYLHGPFLPKNIAIADFLLTQAINIIEPNTKLKQLDDALANRANEFARNLEQ